jgi:RND family efflux transporter MFP subunit
MATQSLTAAAQFKLGVAQQDLAQARRNMEETAVRAPNAGVVTQRNVDPGVWVKGSKPLFLLDRIQPIYAVAEIPQEKAAYVSLSQQASVVFDSYPTETFRGAITKIDPTVDPSKRSFKAFVTLDNPGLRLRPGMAGFTRIENRRKVTLVPRIAVINPTGAPSVEATVFVLEGDRVQTRKVRLGKPEGVGKVEVLGGLSPGEHVVVWGQKDLNPGDRVKPEGVSVPRTTLTRAP